MRARVALTVVYGVALGAWYYLEQKQLDVYSQGTYDLLHSPAFGIGLCLLTIVVGALVARWWVLGSLGGPLCVLLCLQASGYVSPSHDGVPPLGYQNLFGLLLVGGLLLFGVAVGAGFTWRDIGTGRPGERRRS